MFLDLYLKVVCHALTENLSFFIFILSVNHFGDHLVLRIQLVIQRRCGIGAALRSYSILTAVD